MLILAVPIYSKRNQSMAGENGSFSGQLGRNEFARGLQGDGLSNIGDDVQAELGNYKNQSI